VALVVALASCACGFATDLRTVQQLYDGGHFVEAWQQARQVVARQPLNAEALYWSGLAALRCGAIKEAESALTRSVKLRPDYYAAAFALGEVFEKADRIAKAIEWYEVASRLAPKAPEPLARIGKIYQDNGAWGRASAYYGRSQALGPTSGVTEALGTMRQAQREQARGVVSAETFRSLAGVARGVKPLPAQPVSTALPQEPAQMAFRISFPRDKSEVSDLSIEARAQLDEVSRALLSPEWKTRRPMVVEGHACSCGSASQNLELGRKRAEAIRQYLVSKGALTSVDSESTSKGESNPLEPSSNPELSQFACERNESHNLNRRVVLKEKRSGAVAQVSFWYRPIGGGEFRPLTSGAELRSKDQIKVKVESFEPVHAYVFHHGSAGDWAVLFPNKRVTNGDISANPLPASTPLWLPGTGDGLELDDIPGKEQTLVFVSPGPDPELERVAARLRGEVPRQRPASLKQPTPDSAEGATSGSHEDSRVPPENVTAPAASGDQEGEWDIITRSLKGVAASKPGSILLKLRSYASVSFEHRARP